MSKASKMVTCKHCGTEIAASAKVCPKCGGKNKKPIYKRPWFIALIVIIIIGAIGSAGGDKTSNEAGNNDTQVTTSENTNSTQPESETPEITYEENLCESRGAFRELRAEYQHCNGVRV